jgi:hypothetical protein
MLGLLSTHISISEQIKNTSEQRQLMEVGLLEQDIVYGEKSSQELIKYLAGTCRGRPLLQLPPGARLACYCKYKGKAVAVLQYACHIQHTEFDLPQGVLTASQLILMTAAV